MDEVVMAGIAGAEVMLESEPHESKWNSRRVSSARLRLSSIGAGSTDPREAYRNSSDPNDPMHENFPKVTTDELNALVPVVVSTVGHPNGVDCLKGLGPMCAKATCMCALVLLAWIGLVTTSDSTMCSVEEAAGAQARCNDPSQDDLYLQECNKCFFAYDNVCDEADRGGATSQCKMGTDSFDCFISDQTRRAIDCADKATDMILSLTAQALLLIALVASLILPCVGCMGWFIPQCAYFKLTKIPLVSDFIFEVVRSRSLAVVEITSVFLLIAGIAFDTRMCSSSFSLHPRKTTMACTDSRGETVLPSATPASIASFRESDEHAKVVLQALFILRFVFCNLANNQWQSIGKNLTGAALVIGIFVSTYSLILLSDDVSYCEFPVSIEQNFGNKSHCYVYAVDASTTWGLGGWKNRMPVREFISGDIGSNGSKLEGWEEWSKTEVGFYQLYHPTTATPTTKLEFVEPKANDLLPSRRSVFVEQGAREMRLAARRSNQTSGIVNLDTTADSNDNRGNAQLLGSMIEAIALYGEDCESNERMRDSTLMSMSQFFLNCVEVFMLLSSLLTMCTPTKPRKTGRCRRCTASHADATVHNIDFVYPIRMLGAIAVSMLLIAGTMSSIDYWASQTENQIVAAEAIYNEVVIPVLRGESVTAAPSCVAVYGPQDPTCSTAPGCTWQPSFPLPQHAEAKCSACFTSTEGEESCVTGEDSHISLFPTGLGSVCGNVPDTCRWTNDGECDAGSFCPDCTDVADCGPSARAWCDFQGDNVTYGCRYVPQQLAPSDLAWIFNELGTELVEEERHSSVCEYEGDGECDVTTYCPCGTDLTDCGVEILESDICRISYHNAYFDAGGRLPPHKARPPFTKLDDDCDCSWFSLVVAQASLLSTPVSDLITGYLYSQTDGGRRRMQSSRRDLQEEPCVFGSCANPGTPISCVDDPVCSSTSYVNVFTQAQAGNMPVCELWSASIQTTVAGMVQPQLPVGTSMEMLCPISCQASGCNPEPEPQPQPEANSGERAQCFPSSSVNPSIASPPSPPTTDEGQCTAAAPTVQNGAYTVRHLSGHSEATLACTYGYTPSSYGSSITCSNTDFYYHNRWSQAGTCTPSGSAPPPPDPFATPPPPPPTTSAGQCSAPAPTVQAGIYTVQQLSGQSEASLACLHGYTPSTLRNIITCSNERWQSAGSCVPSSSVNPSIAPPPSPPTTDAGQCTAAAPTVQNGAYTVRHLPDHSEATMACTYGYTPSSYGSSITCSSELNPPNRWSQAGTCTPPVWPAPPPPDPFVTPPPPPPPPAEFHCSAPAPTVMCGIYTVQHVFDSSEASLACMHGYTPSVSGEILTCINNAWQTAGSCVPSSLIDPSIAPPPYFQRWCDFYTHTCRYENDGECDAGTYCPDGTDVADCSNLQPEPEPQPSTCRYENDGECDAGTYCPDGTDVADCSNLQPEPSTGTAISCADDPVCSSPSYVNIFARAQDSIMPVCELWSASIQTTVAGMVQPQLPVGTSMEMLCPISCQSSVCNREPEPEPAPVVTGGTSILAGNGTVGGGCCSSQTCECEGLDSCTVVTDAPFEWVDIIDTGTQITSAQWQNNGDDGWFRVNLPFNFHWFGTVERTITIGTNGVLSLGDDQLPYGDSMPVPCQWDRGGQGAGLDGCVQNGGPGGHYGVEIDGIIAVFWCDFNPDAVSALGEGVFYTVVKSEDVRLSTFDKLIVEYKVPVFDPTRGIVATYYTFEVILAGDGSVLLQYRYMPDWAWLVRAVDIGRASIGFEDQTGTKGVQISYGQVPPDETAYFIPPTCHVGAGEGAYSMEPEPEPQLSTCRYENDGECDAGTYCPAGTDVADCSGGTCEYENDGECDAGTYCPAGTDVADCYCPYENDGMCDVPAFCPLHTDTVDCRDVDGGTMNMDDYCATIDENAEDCGDGSGDCCCKRGYNYQQGACASTNPWAKMQEIRDILQSPETARAFKCALQYWRQYWEPLPFCLRYAGIIAVVIAIGSTILYMLSFRKRALRLRELVELHFDAETGWPKDPTVLNDEDVKLLTGGKRSWNLQYSFLQKLPSFLGLYCGNMVFSFLIHWAVWFVVLYVSTCQAFPSDPVGTFVLLVPVIAESIVKYLAWDKIISVDNGIIHPRIYALVDVVLSIVSAYTGAIKTVFRLVGGTLCLFMHIFRSDVTMMLDKSFYPLDPHFTSCSGMLTALRVNYEFCKIRRAKLNKDLDDQLGGPSEFELDDK